MPVKRAIRGLQKALKLEEEESQEVKERIKALEFYKEFGMRAALKYANISRATLYNWQKKYKEYGKAGLVAGNRCPKRKRQSQIPQEVKDFVEEFRHRPYCQNASRHAIKPELDIFCQENKFKKLCSSQIGRVIRQLKEKGLINNFKKLSVKYKPEKCGDLWQIDR
jgi:transposase